MEYKISARFSDAKMFIILTCSSDKLVDVIRLKRNLICRWLMNSLIIRKYENFN
jgi:hypothetical protein